MAYISFLNGMIYNYFCKSQFVAFAKKVFIYKTVMVILELLPSRFLFLCYNLFCLVRLTCEPYWLTAQMPCLFLVSSMHGFLKGSFFFSCYFFCFCLLQKKQNDPASKVQDFFLWYNADLQIKGFFLKNRQTTKKIKPCIMHGFFVI